MMSRFVLCLRGTLPGWTLSDNEKLLLLVVVVRLMEIARFCVRAVNARMKQQNAVVELKY